MPTITFRSNSHTSNLQNPPISPYQYRHGLLNQNSDLASPNNYSSRTRSETHSPTSRSTSPSPSPLPKMSITLKPQHERHKFRNATRCALGVGCRSFLAVRYIAIGNTGAVPRIFWRTGVGNARQLSIKLGKYGGEASGVMVHKCRKLRSFDIVCCEAWGVGLGGERFTVGTSTGVCAIDKNDRFVSTCLLFVPMA